MSSRVALVAAATPATVVLVTGGWGASASAAADTPGVIRKAGADRYATAAAAALQEWDTSRTVVVASGRGGTDALAAASLAGASAAPVLLSDRDQAPAVTGVRVVRTSWSDRSVHRLAPHELVRSFDVDPGTVAGTVGETLIEDVDATGSQVLYRIVLDGPGGVSAISDATMVSGGA